MIKNKLKNLLQNEGDFLDKFGRTPKSTTPYSSKELADSAGGSPEAITVFKPKIKYLAGLQFPQRPQGTVDWGDLLHQNLLMKV